MERRKPVFTDPLLARVLMREMRHLHGEQHVEIIGLGRHARPCALAYRIAHCHCRRVIQRLKSRSGIAINRITGESGARVWQRGFHDRALRQDEDMIEAARYIVANPLRAGLVERIGDYPSRDAVWL
ncbi:transposase [Stutzerimonas stutzeri]|uniref:transposase n=1 Tax=Stutzerimonas stutzeri TaxID=316 RepID=UPI003C6EC6D6